MTRARLEREKDSEGISDWGGKRRGRERDYMTENIILRQRIELRGRDYKQGRSSRDIL